MAKQPTEFAYRSVQLYKSESLGSGSYGKVCKARCDGLLCAAKIMHPTLFDERDPGTASYLRKFEKECHLLSLARHPNVVQYLGTYTDPDTQLPVLLMELCDESLTSFLERSPGPLSYHVQVNICHDIALALVYLHSNGLIHRDLTGNNVLMIAGARAKITDFGMSKLVSVKTCMTALTLCPGNVLYMSPEALDNTQNYTDKLDIFSFGVIVIQILTRRFPNPTDRFRLVSVPQFEEPLRQEVPEAERRAAHLQLIPQMHSMKPLALQCLEKKESLRPSAVQLSEKVLELKQSPEFTESKCQMSKKYKANEQENLSTSQAKGLATTNETPKADEAKGLNQQQQSSEQLVQSLHEKDITVGNLQQNLEQKDKTITDLLEAIAVQQRKIKQLERQDTTGSSDQQQTQPVTSRQTSLPEPIPEPQKDISGMRWRRGKNAPEPMTRGAVVVHGSTAYFRPANSCRVYSYRFIHRDEQWSRLPDNPNNNFGLAVIDGFVTSVGGRNGRVPSDTVLSLNGREWLEIFPPMPTAREDTACVTTEQGLVVAGGWSMDAALPTVEVMSFSSKQWATATSLPQECWSCSASICGDSLYLTDIVSSKSVFACSLENLYTSTALGQDSHGVRGRTESNPGPDDGQTIKQEPRCKSIWKEIDTLPVTRSTLVSFGGYLLAVGGKDVSGKPSSTVYKYDSDTDCWTITSHMKNKRYRCLALSFLEDNLIVVGGFTQKLLRSETATDSVEILS